MEFKFKIKSNNGVFTDINKKTGRPIRCIFEAEVEPTEIQTKNGAKKTIKFVQISLLRLTKTKPGEINVGGVGTIDIGDYEQLDRQ